MTKDVNLTEQLKHYFGFDKFKGDQGSNNPQSPLRVMTRLYWCRRVVARVSVLPVAVTIMDGTAPWYHRLSPWWKPGGCHQWYEEEEGGLTIQFVTQQGRHPTGDGRCEVG